MNARGERGVTPIQSVERAVEMLCLFDARTTEMSLADMRARLGMNMATAHRYAITLRQTGLLQYDPVARSYGLGPRIIQLGTAALNGLRLTRIAAEYLARLVAMTNFTAIMSIWDGEAPVVVRSNNQTSGLVALDVRVGTRLPPLGSAQGKVFLAFSAAARRVHGLGELDAPGGGRQAALLAELREIRDSGMALNDQVLPGLRAIATPVMQAAEVAGAIGLIGTSASLPSGFDAAPAKALRKIAHELSVALGGQPTTEAEAPRSKRKAD